MSEPNAARLDEAPATDRRRVEALFRGLEMLFAVISLTLITSHFWHNQLFTVPLWRFRALLFPIYGVTCGLLLLRGRRTLRSARALPSTALLVVLAFLSALWSGFPAQTLERAAALAGTTLFGLYLASRYDLRVLLRMLALILGASILASVALARVSPEAAIELGLWNGIYVHKNTLGAAMALAVLVYYLLARQPGAWIWWPALLAALILVWLSGSRTGQIETVAILLLPPLLFVARHSPRWRGLATAAGAAAVVLGVGAILYLGMRPPSSRAGDLLTGRVQLWSLLIPKIMAHPWLGYGYEAFWEATGPAVDVWVSVVRSVQERWNINTAWFPRHAHNGYLNLVLELGLAGLVLFAVDAVRGLRALGKLVEVENGPKVEWIAAYLVLLTLLYNVVETSIPSSNNLLWCLYVVTLVYALRPQEGAPQNTGSSWRSLRIAGGIVIALGLVTLVYRGMGVQAVVRATRHNDAGVALMAAEQYDAALAHFDKAVRVGADWHVPYVNRAIVLQQLGDDDQAAAAFDRAVSLDLEGNESLLYRAEFHLARGRFDAARRDFESAIATGASYRAHKGAAIAAAGLGSSSLCLEHTLACMRLDPQQVPRDIAAISAPFFGDAGQSRAGTDYYTELLAYYPGEWWVHYNLGVLAARLGLSEQAMESFDRAEELKAASQ